MDDEFLNLEDFEDLYDNMNDDERREVGFVSEKDVENTLNGLVEKYNEITGSHCKNVEEFVEEFRKSEQEMKKAFENKAYLIEPKRYTQLLSSFSIVKSLFKDRKDVIISLQIDNYIPNSGSICVKGRDVIFNDVKKLLKVAKLADKFEIYPTVHETVNVYFTFLNIATDGSD